jgi:hypothetical protein
MTQSKKITWIVLVAAFIVSVFMYGTLVMLLSQRPATAVTVNVDTLRSVCYTVAGAGILTAAYWALVKLPAAPDDARFQTDMILALALAEVSCIMGMLLFFLSHKSAEFWPFGIATLVVNLVFILPRVLQRT